MGAALGCVDEFAFLASGAKLYLADFCDGVASEYDYPAGGAAEKTITVEANEPASVAVTPPWFRSSVEARVFESHVG